MLKPLSRHLNPLKPVVPVSTSSSRSSSSSFYIYWWSERDIDRYILVFWESSRWNSAVNSAGIVMFIQFKYDEQSVEQAAPKLRASE